MMMSTSFLFVLMLAAQPEQTEQQMQRQQQQLDQVGRQLDQQKRQLDRLIEGLDAQPDRRNQRTVSVCSVEMRRADGRLDSKDGRPLVGSGTVIPLNLLSTVS